LGLTRSARSTLPCGLRLRRTESWPPRAPTLYAARWATLP
jgi:hypothetical protein